MMLNRRLCVAPMMACTDRHDRYFLRLITRHTLLYTEMTTAGALLHGNADRLLEYDPAEHPVALQIAGSHPAEMAECARMAGDYGYDEVNVNVGCPSDRVKSGRFGACLMADPEIVADCVESMSSAAELPVTVKTRLGIDDRDSYEDLERFIRIVAKGGCRTFIIHARKAWLNGLSPKQNRHVPPLRYDLVQRLKLDFPQLEIIINGGIRSLREARQHLQKVDGVMIGREAYRNPYLLAEADRVFFYDAHAVPNRHEIVEAYLPYVERQLAKGVYLSHLTRHILGLYYAEPGAKAWRRHLSENAHKAGADAEVIRRALEKTSRGEEYSLRVAFGGLS